MTRKDFQLVADWFKRYALGIDCCPDHDPRIMALELSNALATTNPNFDRGKFLKACGVEISSW